MSLMLGPIHHWIFEQIKLVEARGESLVAALSAKLGAELAGRWQEICAAHPGQFAGRELEQLVDANIHGSLDAMIATVQAREAALVAWILERAPEEGEALLRDAFAAEGRRVGESLREHIPHPDPPQVFAALRELWLEGMPCDVNLQLEQQSPNRVSWLREGAPLARYWREAGVAITLMEGLHAAWRSAFVAALDPRLTLRGTPPAAGDTSRYAFELRLDKEA